MNIFSSSPSASSSSSSSSSTSKFTLFSTSQNPNPSKFHSFNVPIKTLLLHSSPPPRPLLPPPLSSHQPPLLHENPQSFNSSATVCGGDGGDENDEDGGNGEIRTAKESLEELLVVRRPVMEVSEEDGGGDDELSSSAIIDVGLSEFARKMPIFEPERVELSSGEKPLVVNLDLALYRAKVLARSFRYNEAEKLLQKCINTWPEDGRPYVALGKILSKQSKTAEARAVYEKGCQATQGENAYVWQCWAVLENKNANVRRARELFDAATVADKRHIAAWHGWAVLELKQGNIKKARNLLGKGLKYCGGNQYIYQTLALLEVKATRYEQVRYLFKQATKSNPKSCASWLVSVLLKATFRCRRMIFCFMLQGSLKFVFLYPCTFSSTGMGTIGDATGKQPHCSATF
ncbi:hypothetical protein ACSBR2_013669 [Camellia fascicularis]